MLLSSSRLLSFISLPALITSLQYSAIEKGAYEADSILRRDAVIIGGGSSGTYAAIGLRDKGKTVAVIEQKNLLGGHTNTYTDPATKTPVDYGVIVFDNSSIVTSYFNRFNIPLTTGTGRATGSFTESYIDFSTGKNITSYVPPDPTAAFNAYATQLQKYPSLNKPGWNVPDPVPADLLLPFGDFVKKYKLDGAVPTIYFFAQGFGDILSIPTLYFVKYFSLSFLQGVETGFLITSRHDNSELYEKARTELGDDVLLNSTVLSTDRSGTDVKVSVQTPAGKKLVIAKKLVISIPPLLSNLNGFDLTDNERSLFSQFTSGALYTGLLNHTGIPDNVEITAVKPNTPYNLPQLPTLYGLYLTAVPGLKQFLYGNSAPLSDNDVRSSIVSQIQKLKTAGTIPTASTPEFVAYSNHYPYELRVSADAIAKGFYKNLTALQGQTKTYWTGAAFDRHDSGSVWAFTEGLLGGIAA